MADSKYVVFNCTRGPITITLYRQSDLVELAKHASYKRRRLAKEVFTTVVVQSNSSKDLVAETGISIEELEKNKELQHLIILNKFRVMVNTDKPVVRPELRLQNKAALQSKPVEKKVEEPVIEEVIEEVVEDIPKEEKHVQVVVSDFVEEVVDPEELRNILIQESDAVDRGDDEEVVENEIVADLPKEEKPKTEKKRGRKPKKTRK